MNKQFQGSKKKGRKKAYEERQKRKHWNANEMSRLARRMGLIELSKKLEVKE